MNNVIPFPVRHKLGDYMVTWTWPQELTYISLFDRFESAERHVKLTLCGDFVTNNCVGWHYDLLNEGAATIQYCEPIAV